MSLDLIVDAARWRAHLDATAGTMSGLVPVSKGNGYGLGRSTLIDETNRLGIRRLAVGTYAEAVEARATYSSDILVMQPWRPFFDDQAVRSALGDAGVIHTVSRVEDFASLAKASPGVRVVVEGRTSMDRYGLLHEAFSSVAAYAGDVVVEGASIHLPLAPSNTAEAAAWLRRLDSSELGTKTLYVSHLSPRELADLRTAHPEVDLRARVGTSLWLGDLGAFSVQSTVLDVHPVTRGQHVGYHQRPVPRDGHLVVLSGGTSHGIGLRAPRSVSSPSERAKGAAKGVLEAGWRAQSPFRIGGKKRWFVEAPHMQVSLVFVPSSVTAPKTGDTVDVAVRYTTTAFDSVTLA